MDSSLIRTFLLGPPSQPIVRPGEGSYSPISACDGNRSGQELWAALTTVGKLKRGNLSVGAREGRFGFDWMLLSVRRFSHQALEVEQEVVLKDAYSKSTGCSPKKLDS